MTAPIATLRGITYRYPNAEEPALRDVNVDIGPGLTLVAGRSGGGKSTLLRLLNGLVPQFHGGRVAGSALVAGLDPLRTPVAKMARQVGLVFQDVETQSVYGTVEREIAFGLENTAMPRAHMHDRVDAVLAAMSIELLRSRRLSTLSGGERQRVQLAAVLALEPQVIALDEPTSQLDRRGAQAVLEACRSLASQGRAIVLAEHRLDDLLAGVDMLLIVDDGCADGPSEPASLAAKLASPPPLVELGRALGWAPLPLTVEEAIALLPRASGGPLDAHPEVARACASPVLGWEVRDLSIGPEGRPIAEGISIAAAAGEVVAVVGANGSGKTTLLRTLAGLLPPVSGTVERRVERVAYVPQNPGSLLHLPTLRAEVDLTIRRLGIPTSSAEVLESFGLAELADRYPRDLSSGERQRAALAATLAGSPGLALLDEPTRGMDLRARRSLGRIVRSMSAAGSSVVIATHDVDLAAEVADRVVLLEDGRATDLGPPGKALASGSEWSTQIGRLLPGGPVTVEGAIAGLAPFDGGSDAAAGSPAGAATAIAERQR
jgi:energy-coupling factor transport system ATP-binding protein